MVLQGILVAIEPVFVVLMDIIYLAINTILSIQITMSGLIYSLIILFIISSLYEKYRNIILKLNKLKNETENNISKVDLARTLDESERHLKKLITREEKVNKTIHPKIMIMQNGTTSQRWDDLKIDIEELINITNTFNSDAIKQKLQQMMPEYEPLDYYPAAPDDYINKEAFEIDKSTIQGQA